MKKNEKKEESKISKKNIIIVVLVAVITLLVLASIITIYNNKNIDALKFKEEYESINGTTREKDGKTIRSITIPKNNPMVYSDADKIVDMINNKETFVVYFGFNDCPWCRSVITTLIDVANDEGLDKIYYVDVKEIRGMKSVAEDGSIKTDIKGTKGYYKLLEKLDGLLSDYTLMDKDGNQVLAGEKRIYAPNVVAIVNGKAEKLESGISDKQTDGYMKLTEEMKKETYDKFKCLIKCVTESNKSCSPKSGC